MSGSLDTDTILDDEEVIDIEFEDDFEAEEPPMYRVLLHNDDYTPMEFVESIVTQVFHCTKEVASKVTLSIHENGQEYGPGEFTAEVAETKANTINVTAGKYEFPFQATIEPA